METRRAGSGYSQATGKGSQSGGVAKVTANPSTDKLTIS